jgi:GTP:adenosylcobinamide-phosphate guanylyltransferase/aminoglycoside phosphotransferase
MKTDVKYIVVQAGGKGTRLGGLTRNKPKAVVPVNNLPVIFHLFQKFPEKNYIIIGDYKYTVFEKYLETFAAVKYILVRAYENGTCAGIRRAVEYIPTGEAFMLIWSDLILAPDVDIDGFVQGNYAGISSGFECRWSFVNGIFEETPSKENGVAGMFIFSDKTQLTGMPETGEFVKFLRDRKLKFKPFGLFETKEVGTIAGIKSAQVRDFPRCRSFNRLEETGDTITKIPLDDLGRKLAVCEAAWYKEIQKYRFKQVPEIVSFNPLTMRRINGKNIFRAALDDVQKRKIIDKIVDSLNVLHSLRKVETDHFSLNDAYYAKTMRRLYSVKNLIPFSDEKEIIINDTKCRNIYFYREEFHALTRKLFRVENFTLIHGDCTFSNTMIDDDGEIIFMDPRGYFGFTEIFGDIAYDWAKVFYSINGDYDQFNNGNFDLTINKSSVYLSVGSNGWRHLSDYYLGKIKDCPAENIRLIHAIIWLSLASYVWEDFDSICGAFYNGILLLNEFMEGKNDRLF